MFWDFSFLSWHLYLSWSASRTLSVFPPLSLFLTCAARWVHPRYTWSKNDTGSYKSTSFGLVLPTSSAYAELILPSSCLQHTLTQEWSHFSMKIWLPQETVSHCSPKTVHVSQIVWHPNGKDCAPAVQLDRQSSLHVVVFLLSVIWSKS